MEETFWLELCPGQDPDIPNDESVPATLPEVSGSEAKKYPL